MRPTVHDIAAAAGVSLATVDRVLNQRAGVRNVTREKVEQAIETHRLRPRRGRGEPRQKPHLSASSSSCPPATIPSCAALKRTCTRRWPARPLERMAISIVKVPAFNAEALVAALDEVRETAPAGVAVVAVESPDVIAAVNRLRADAHSGGDAGFRSGRLGARSFRRRRQRRGRANGGKPDGSFPRRPTRADRSACRFDAVRDHRERLDGFRAVMDEDFPGHTLLPVIEGQDDPVLTEKLVGEALAASPGTVGIYSLGAGNRGLIAALETARQCRRRSASSPMN